MILAIVQARMSSTRLPGKVLAPIQGEPLVVRQLERIARAASLDAVVVATSIHHSDDPLAEQLLTRGVAVRRGPLDDVLARFAMVVEEFRPDHVVRLTADNPLVDPAVVDRVVAEHLEFGADYSSNSRVRSFPYGLDVECFRAEAFSRVLAAPRTAYDHEHVTPPFYEHGAEFSVHQVVSATDLSAFRWSVDYPEDLEFVREVFRDLYPHKPNFDSNDVVELLEAHPELIRRVGEVS